MIWMSGVPRVDSQEAAVSPRVLAGAWRAKLRKRASNSLRNAVGFRKFLRFRDSEVGKSLIGSGGSYPEAGGAEQSLD